MRVQTPATQYQRWKKMVPGAPLADARIIKGSPRKITDPVKYLFKESLVVTIKALQSLCCLFLICDIK